MLPEFGGKWQKSVLRMECLNTSSQIPFAYPAMWIHCVYIVIKKCQLTHIPKKKKVKNFSYPHTVVMYLLKNISRSKDSRNCRASINIIELSVSNLLLKTIIIRLRSLILWTIGCRYKYVVCGKRGCLRRFVFVIKC